MRDRVGALWTLAVISLLSVARGQVLSFGFSEIDYLGNEDAGVTIAVTKEGPNVGDLYINVATLTYAQLESMQFPIPPEVPGPGNRPDAAEFSQDGKQDFNSITFQVVFPATSSTDQVQVTRNISFIDDLINEEGESFYLLATVDRMLSNQMDAQVATAERNGVALVTINDNDLIQLTFEQQTYDVPESAGLVDDLIFVAKQDGGVSEQILTINVQVFTPGGLGSATRGPIAGDLPQPFDFSLPALAGNLATTFQLMFQVADSRLPISLDIIDDLILERNETFQLSLAIPQNPADNLRAGTIQQASVNIFDNEVGTIGFVQSKYEVFENETELEVCAAILNSTGTEIADDVEVFIFAETVDGTAQGNVDFQPLVAGQFIGDNVDIFSDQFVGCARLTLIDDSLVEGTETLQVSLVVDDPNAIVSGNFIFDPTVTEVCILDDDADPTAPQPTSVPSIAPSSAQPSPSPSPSSPEPLPTRVPVTPMPSVTPTSPTNVGMGGDPHYSILLPTGQLLCYSVHGEHDFAFNLISNKMMQMNALFVADARREEVTWIGELGVVVRHGPRRRANSTSLRFCASQSMVCVGDKIQLSASGIEKMTFSQGKLSISERVAKGDQDKPSILVEFPDIGLSFTVTFVRGKHLDMTWNKVADSMGDSHGMIGQFFRGGVEIDEVRRLLVLPDMEPVAVMRKPVWHFMERDSPDEQLCWVAMNPGYQGKKLLQGHYLDYLVDDVLATNFKFKPSKN